MSGERRERDRELMRSNSERDRSTNSHPRELVRGEVDQREVSYAKYVCRGEVREIEKKKRKKVFHSY